MRQVVLYPDLEDGGWIVEVPSWPGCISQGETKEDALSNIQDAIEVWIAGATTVGQ
jgi:predicted RNase H-like HicB family nuclease